MYVYILHKDIQKLKIKASLSKKKILNLSKYLAIKNHTFLGHKIVI